MMLRHHRQGAYLSIAIELACQIGNILTSESRFFSRQHINLPAQLAKL